MNTECLLCTPKTANKETDLLQLIANVTVLLHIVILATDVNGQTIMCIASRTIKQFVFCATAELFVDKNFHEH